MPSYIQRYKNPFFLSIPELLHKWLTLVKCQKSKCWWRCKGITQQNKRHTTQKESGDFSSIYCFLQQEDTLFKKPNETFWLRYHLLLTLQVLQLSASVREYKKKSCKVNSSCNWNWLPPTQGHSLWTSHSPYSRLTLNMPYWTPLGNNSSIGNFQGTGCEETKNISLVAVTHIICHSFERVVIHTFFFLLLLKAIFTVFEQFLKLPLI